MIRVTLFIGEAGQVSSVRSQGHAGYAQAGEDIVCAAVSALIQTAAMAVAKRGGVVKIVEEPASAEVSLGPKMAQGERREAEIVLGAIADGLRSIHQGYADYMTLQEV